VGRTVRRLERHDCLPRAPGLDEGSGYRVEAPQRGRCALRGSAEPGHAEAYRPTVACLSQRSSCPNRRRTRPSLVATWRYTLGWPLDGTGVPR